MTKGMLRRRKRKRSQGNAREKEKRKSLLRKQGSE